MALFDELAKLARSAAHEVEKRVDDVKETLAPRDPSAFWLQPYRGFGTAESFRLTGRAHWGRPLDPASEGHSILDNVFDAFRRFESDEMAGGWVTVRFGSSEERVRTDEEGYFAIDLAVHPEEVGPGRWQPVECVLQPPGGGEHRARATAEVLIPGNEAEFGIVSDIDDTVMVTGAANLLSILRLTLLHNARTRSPFTGVDGLYRALVGGDGADVTNPLFYVSSSPHNLYDMLEDFFRVKRMPRGPILLRDVGLDPERWFKADHEVHKTEKIERILATYPQLDFVLIGDSGQKDPEIYCAVAERHPGRIRVIYIRDVATDARDAEIDRLAKRTERVGTPMVLTSDSRVAARDAAERGLVDEAAVAEVRRAFEQDMDRPTDAEAAADAVTPDLGGDGPT